MDHVPGAELETDRAAAPGGRRRTLRTWHRGTVNEAAQWAALTAMRLLVTGAGLLLWWRGEAGAGDLAAVLTMFFVVQGYLRDVGYHLSNLQRSVNEMEEMVAMVAEIRPTRNVTQIASSNCSLRYSEAYHRVEKPPQTVTSRLALNE